MSYNSSTFYEYNRSFNASGIFNYTINCNHTTYDNLSASDNVTITADDTAPDVTNPFVEEAVNNWVRNNTLITFNVTINDTQSGVKNATVNVSLINITGENISLTLVQGTDYWNGTVLADKNTSEEIVNLTVFAYDIAENYNSSVNITVGVDDTPPPSITNLNETANGTTWINWTWDNPALPYIQPSSDFNHTLIYINETWKTNVSNTTTYYNATSLASNTTYNISTRTVDLVGNINYTWKNGTVTTQAAPLDTTAPNSTTNLTITLNTTNYNITLNWTASNSTDDVASYSIYISSNATLSCFNFSSPNETVDHPTTNWIDGNATLTPERYYIVRAKDEVGNEEKNNNTVGKFNISLGAGWEIISIPLNLSANGAASWQLGEESEVGNPLPVDPPNSIEYIFHYHNTGASGYFDLSRYFDGWGWWRSMTLEPGIGYFLYTTQPCNLTIVGAVPVNNVTINIVEGWNLVGWYSLEQLNLNGKSTLTNPSEISPQGSINMIFYWDNPTNNYGSVINSGVPLYMWFGDTTTLKPGEGYWFKATQSCEWEHEPQRG